MKGTSPQSTRRAARTSGAHRAGHGVKGGSSQANRLAVAILEVLAGVRTPGQAAQSLALSVPRYYQLETRALEGLVSACEPKPVGKQPSPLTRVRALERQLARMQRDLTRQQSLARAAQRSVGLTPPAAPSTKSAATDSRGRRRRRPTIRALRAARALAKNIRTEDEQTVKLDNAETGEARPNHVLSSEKMDVIETEGVSPASAASVNRSGRTRTTSVDPGEVPKDGVSLNQQELGTDSLVAGRSLNHGGT